MSKEKEEKVSSVPDISFGSKIHPLIATLPPHLKDPKNYYKIKKLIIESLAGKCSHGEAIEWAKCPKCQKRFAERTKILKSLGFKNPAQYLVWQKIHEEIKARYPLVDWKKENAMRALEKLHV